VASPISAHKSRCEAISIDQKPLSKIPMNLKKAFLDCHFFVTVSDQQENGALYTEGSIFTSRF
jgi:hypothetical protein